MLGGRRYFLRIQKRLHRSMILRRAWKPSLNVCLFLSHLWLLGERPSWWDCRLMPMGMPSSWRLEIRDEGQIQGQIFHPIIRLRISTFSWEIENSQTNKNRLMTSSGYIIEWPWSACFWRSKWSCLCQMQPLAALSNIPVRHSCQGIHVFSFSSWFICMMIMTPCSLLFADGVSGRVVTVPNSLFWRHPVDTLP